MIVEDLSALPWRGFSRVANMIVVIACTVLLCAQTAYAAVYRVHTTTSGRATQFVRVDQTVAARRPLLQAVRLDAYDLTDDQSGRLNARVAVRYFTDWGLEESFRFEDRFEHQWNHLALDVAYLEWKPLSFLVLNAGRQWSVGALGARDFDGLRLRSMWSQHGASVYVEAYGGWDIQPSWSTMAPMSWDVQGIEYLPIDEPEYEPGKLLLGVHAGMRLGRALNMETAYQRRFGQDTLSEERVGLAFSSALLPRLALNGNYAYHTLLKRTERLGTQVAWQLPLEDWTVASIGFDHRHRWFDSASIFNLFGTRPHQDYYLSLQRAFSPLTTVAEMRVWQRLYDLNAPWPRLKPVPEGARAWGAALSHRSRIPTAVRTFDWSSTLSYQHHGASDAKGDQWLGDIRVRAPLAAQRFFVFARTLGLLSYPTDVRRTREWVATTIVGAEYRVLEAGTLSAMVDLSVGSYMARNTSAYISFELEVWR